MAITSDGIWKKRIGGFDNVSAFWFLITIPAIISGIWAVFIASQPEVPGYGEGIERMFAIPIIGFAHTAGGGIASIIGGFQFLNPLRKRWPRAHVWLGRIYLTAVGVSALAGLYLSPGSLAANTFGIAFILLALAWIYTGWMAYSTVRECNFPAHRRWMIRNFALTYAAVTLRIEMPVLMGFGMDPILALNIVGWTCWIPNLLAVEWWIRRKQSSPTDVRPAFAK